MADEVQAKLELAKPALQQYIADSAVKAINAGADALQAKFEAGASALVEKATAPLQAKIDSLGEKVKAGTATPWEAVLYTLLTGGGIGGIGKLIRAHLKTKGALKTVISAVEKAGVDRVKDAIRNAAKEQGSGTVSFLAGIAHEVASQIAKPDDPPKP